jgi:hypothetical protein
MDHAPPATLDNTTAGRDLTHTDLWFVGVLGAIAMAEVVGMALWLLP